MHRLRAVTAGLVVIVVVCMATPAVLVMITVLAWTTGGPASSDPLVQIALRVADVVAWVAWITYVVGLGRDVMDCLRHPGHDRGLGVRGRAAGWVAGMVLVVAPAGVLVGSTTAGASPAPVVSSAPATVASSAPITPPGPGGTGAGITAAVPQAVAGATSTYVVQPGDCLSAIAEVVYGTAGDWTTIWSANAGAVMPTGRQFVDPNLIMPGQQLTLPGISAPAATPVPMPTPTTPGASPAVGSAAGSATGTGAGSVGTPSPRAGATTASHDAQRTSLPDHQGTHRSRPTPDAQRRPSTLAQAASGAPGTASSGGGPLWVPEAVGLGISSVVAAALARMVRRRRASARRVREDDEIVPDPPPETAAVETNLVPFDSVPALDILEAANRYLTTALRMSGRAEDVPGIHLVRVGPFGVELLLDDAVDWAPGEFALADEGRSWVLDAAIDHRDLAASAAGVIAWLPLLLPVGDDEDGTYLIHVGPGEQVGVDGEGADGMLRAWSAAARAWPWAEQVPVAANAEDAVRLVPLFRDQVTPVERGTIAYFGDLAELDATAVTTVAVASRTSEHTGFQVTADGEVAKIEPWGVVVRASAVAVDTADALDKVTAPIVPVPAADPPAPTGGGLVAPGAVEVKLLTFTPRIEGLDGELPSKSKMRSIELAAWVALRGDDGTTAAAMLDEGIAGARTEKTVYNIVASTRAGLGVNEHGQPRLMTDRRTHVYRTTADVTVDVLRFEAMAAAGATAEDPKEAAALCRSALALVEDRPIGNGVGRFAWWSMWEGRVARLATKAAKRLGELAETGEVDLDTARWAVEQARLAAPDDEELVRVAMHLEHWAGNRHGVEAEWGRACQRAEELDPGCGPTPMTEALYNAIRRREQVATGKSAGGDAW